VLATRAAGSVRVHAHIVEIQIDLVITFNDRQHFDERERRVPAMRGIERRKPYQPMGTGLGFGVAICIGAIDLQRAVLDPCLFPVGRIENLGPETRLPGPLHIHSQQHLRPILGIDSTFTGMDDQNCV
jgi:hypothetical protein